MDFIWTVYGCIWVVCTIYVLYGEIWTVCALYINCMARASGTALLPPHGMYTRVHMGYVFEYGLYMDCVLPSMGPAVRTVYGSV